MKRQIFCILAAAALLFSLTAACGDTQDSAAVEPSELIDLAADDASPAEPTETPGPPDGMIAVSNGAGGTMWAVEATELAEFPYDRNAFSVSNGVVAYAGQGLSLVHGIDVSEFQGDIDWSEVAADGVVFAIIRIGWRGYSGGTLNADENYRRNIEGALAAGLQVGAYFYSQATSIFEAGEEAIFCADLLEDYDLQLPVFFDWEFIDSVPARTDDVDTDTRTESALMFCRLLESAGHTAGVYTYIPQVYTMYNLDDLANTTLWIGNPGSFPDFYYNHTYWQYSFTGSIRGVDGPVDLDVIYIPSTVVTVETFDAEPAAAPAESAQADGTDTDDAQPDDAQSDDAQADEAQSSADGAAPDDTEGAA